jgi:hypothetical protein
LHDGAKARRQRISCSYTTLTQPSTQQKEQGPQTQRAASDLVGEPQRLLADVLELHGLRRIHNVTKFSMGDGTNLIRYDALWPCVVSCRGGAGRGQDPRLADHGTCLKSATVSEVPVPESSSWRPSASAQSQSVSFAAP